MRQSLLPALLEVAQYNRARQNKHLAFYETGRVFLGQGSDQLPQEAERFAILVSGIETPASWYQKETVYDFFSLKGMVEGYFEALRLGRRVQYLATDRMKVMHPGRTAEVYLDDDYVGFLGQLHPQVAADYDLDRATYFAELDLEVILAADRPELLQQPIAKFPSSTRDLALLVQEDQPHADLVHLIQSQGGPYLVSVDLFDQYAGDNIEDGKQSLAYHLVFQDPERTLTDDEIDQAMSQIQSALETVAGLEIR